MKHHGLLFSAPMARANVGEIKTVMRRVMNPQPPEEVHVGPFRITVADPKRNGIWRKAPWQPGDLIYQKETWAPCDCGRHGCPGTIYLADGKPAVPIKWKSPLHLRKVDARFWAEVLSVRPERLQDITEEDAKAEGVEWIGGPGFYKVPWGVRGTNLVGFSSPREAYRALFNSINGPGSWDANPWVWRIEYRSVARPELAALHA